MNGDRALKKMSALYRAPGAQQERMDALLIGNVINRSQKLNVLHFSLHARTPTNSITDPKAKPWNSKSRTGERFYANPQEAGCH
jgi:hypothetical protein